MADLSDSVPVKRCARCGSEFPATTTFFHPNKGGKYGLRGQCRSCHRAVEREQIKQPENKSRRLAAQATYIASGRNAERNRAWNEANPDKRREIKRRAVAKNREAYRAADTRWRDANRDKVRAKQRRADAKLQKSPTHVLKKRIKARLRQMLKGKSLGCTEAILGYGREDLVRHIERQFTDGMTWEVLMRGDIHIDHIVPVSVFKITGIDCPEFRACWALTNLRPMWAEDNFKKQARVETLL